MNKIIKCNDLNITTYIEDTDFQGFVYHANYLKFFERARSDFLSQNKISQKALRKNNLAFVVKKVNMNFISAAELGYDLIVKSSVEKKSNARMIFFRRPLRVGIDPVEDAHIHSPTPRLRNEPITARNGCGSEFQHTVQRKLQEFRY